MNDHYKLKERVREMIDNCHAIANLITSAKPSALNAADHLEDVWRHIDKDEDDLREYMKVGEA